MDEINTGWFENTFERVKNWGRWGDDDERGTLNLITPERVAAAAKLIHDGRQVSCALDLDTTGGINNPMPAHHHMLLAGDVADEAMLPGLEKTTDYVAFACHGRTVSHLDALCHIAVGGQMYNGVPLSEVRSSGARRHAVTVAAAGICGRGMLLDIPRARGIDSLAATDRVYPSDLEAAEREQGIVTGPGDILLVSIGWSHRRRVGMMEDGGVPGLHATCITWLRDRDIGVLGSDAFSDAIGDDLIAFWPRPIHQCAIAAMGMPLLDNLDLVELSEVCASTARWEFFFTVAPLRIPGGTGCAVNPIAIF